MKFFLFFILGLVSGALLAFIYFKIYPSSQTLSPPPEKIEEEQSPSEVSLRGFRTTSPILLYHYVQKGPNSLYVSLLNFEEQMAYLSAKGFQTISLNDLFEKPSAKKFVITFDDGYKDVFENAYPILKRLGFKATVFVIVNEVGKQGYLDWEEIKILEKEGWSFGSHTLTHRNLLSLKKEGAEKEILESKEELEVKLKNPVNFFCYPVGKYSQEIIEMVSEAGYKGAVTTLSGLDNTISEIYQLKRIRVSGFDTLESFIKKLK